MKDNPEVVEVSILGLPRVKWEWSGGICSLQPGVDFLCGMQRYPGTHLRVIMLSLRRRQEGKQSVEFVTGGCFSMTELGTDYERLEFPGSELIAITQHFTKVKVVLEPGGVLAQIEFDGAGPQTFKLYGLDNPSDWFCIVPAYQNAA